MWLAAKHPDRVKSLSLHSAWPCTDPFLRAVVESWRIMAEGRGSVTDMAIKGIFPSCFTLELYAARLEYIDSLADFVRSRPMPMRPGRGGSRRPRTGGGRRPTGHALDDGSQGLRRDGRRLAD
jgi:hypothetical protein